MKVVESVSSQLSLAIDLDDPGRHFSDSRRYNFLIVNIGQVIHCPCIIMAPLSREGTFDLVSKYIFLPNSLRLYTGECQSHGP